MRAAHLVPFALILSGAVLAQQVTIAWRSDLPRNGLAEAQGLGRCALIYFTDGSEACQAFESSVLSNPGVAVAMREFVPIRADCSSPQAHAALQERLGVNSYPTIVYFAPNGSAVERMRRAEAPAVQGDLLRVLRAHWRPDANQVARRDDPAALAGGPPPRAAPASPARDPGDPGSLREWVNKGGWLERFLRGLVIGLLPLLIAALRGSPAVGLVLGPVGCGAACALSGLPGALGVAAFAVLLTTRPMVTGARASLANLLVFAAGAGVLAWFGLGLTQPERLPMSLRPVGLPTVARDFRTVYNAWDQRMKAKDPNGALEVLDEFELLGDSTGYEGDLLAMRKLARVRGARDPGPRDMRWLVERTLRRRYEEGSLWGDLIAPGGGLAFVLFALFGAVSHRRLKKERAPSEFAEPERGTPRNPLG